MAETAEIQATPETGPAEATATPTATPEPQASVPDNSPKHQPDDGVPAEVLNPPGPEAPAEPDNVKKDITDGNLTSSIDGKVPEGLSNKEEWLHNLLQKEKENPETEFNEDELDIMDEYYEGRLKPTEPKAKEEAKEPDPEKNEDADNSNDSGNSIEDVLKEGGAKDQAELLGKIKDLRKVVSGKVKGSSEYKEIVQKSQQIEKRFQNELHLMEDVQRGIPEAIAHLEKAYGVKIQKPGKPKQEVNQEEAEDDNGSEEYLDDVAGKQIKKLQNIIEGLTEKVNGLEGSNHKIEEKFAGERAEAQLVDEMVNVAERVPVLKQIKNLRGSIIAWRAGKNDPRLDGFETLFKTATTHDVDLVTAHEILAGRNASYEIERARHDAKKEVYTQKPNRSLSDLQGRGVDNKPSYTDEQVQDMINNNNIPEDWYDNNDQPNMRTIPRQYLKYFFSASEIRK